MVAQTRILQQVDGLDTLKALLELAKDPSAILEAHETARKQMALTDAEKVQADEARAFIAQHAKLSKELADAHDALALSKADHESNVAEFKAHADAEAKRLKDLADTLDAKEAQQKDTDIRHKLRENELHSYANNIAKDRAGLAEKATADREENEKVRLRNEGHTLRLSQFETVLKEKAARLKEYTADL